MSRNIVFEGWLTKSPPSKRIWRTKWRRRWFALRQSGDLPGQYFLDYYADRNCRRLKGTINLDLCEQVDAGLHMERAGNGTLDPKLRGSVFTIQTQSRTYHLEADCEAEMEKWVDAICRVCGLRATEEEDTYQNNNAVSTTNDRYERADTTGPYIAISECITGVRAQDRQRAFTFDPKNIVVSAPRATCDKATETRGQHIYSEPPRIKITHVDFSENESNVSDEDCKSLNASQSNIPDWSVTKSFTKLAVKPNRNGASEDGPPIPPRPPKTFARARGPVQRESFQAARIQEPLDPVQESISKYTGPGTPWLRVPRRSSHYRAPRSPSRIFTLTSNASNFSDDEDENTIQHSLQYYNLLPLPPAVDRALKPRYSSHSFGHINSPPPGHPPNQVEELTTHTLQYLDLDLNPSTLSPAKDSNLLRKVDFIHGKSMSSVDDSAYKTVDFLKTEAFNSTRQDAEALRSYQN